MIIDIVLFPSSIINYCFLYLKYAIFPYYFKSLYKEFKYLKLGRVWNIVAEEFLQLFKS